MVFVSNTIQYNTIQYNTIQYNTIQYNTIQYNTIQYNTIQYNIKFALGRRGNSGTGYMINVLGSRTGYTFGLSTPEQGGKFKDVLDRKVLLTEFFKIQYILIQAILGRKSMKKFAVTDEKIFHVCKAFDRKK